MRFRTLKQMVQDATGETKRRELVQKIKDLAFEFKEKVSQAIEKVNWKIKLFNAQIAKLNAVRKEGTKENIDALEVSLSKYGKCKTCDSFAKESDKRTIDFPQNDYEKIDKYLKGIDLTSDEVFWNTFLLTPIGMKLSNRKNNLAMTEAANELTIKIDNTVRELNNKEFIVGIETKICEKYIENVSFIYKTITKRIVPELRLIDAFLEAEQIKNTVVSGNDVSNAKFYYGVSCLIGTPYERHYQFIKNAYMFYIVSCAIYETPILTNLLNHKTKEQDLENIKKEHEVLETQAMRMNQSKCFGRR